MTTTKITNSVIQSNTIISDLIANNQIITRHILDGEVTLAKLAFPLSAEGNADMVQSNLTSLIQDDASLFSTKVFQNVHVANTLIVTTGGTPLFAVAIESSILESEGDVFEMKMNLQLLGAHTAIMSNDPTSALEVATKGYVDNVGGSGGGTIADGTAADPGFIYTSEADMGLWKPAANTIGLSTAGTDRWDIDSAALFPAANITYDIGKDAANFVRTVFTENVTANAGVATRPAYNFKDDENTGLYHIGPDQLGFAAGGTGIWEINTSRLRPLANIGTDIGSAPSNFVRTIYTQNVRANAGVATRPAYTFNNDEDTGLYSVTGDEIGIALGGVRQGIWANASLTANTVGIIDAGTHLGRFANLNFIGSAVASVVNDNLGTVDITLTASAGAGSIDDGTAADPGLIYTTEADMGLWKPSVNTMGFVTSGVFSWGINPGGIFFPATNVTFSIGSKSFAAKSMYTSNLLANTGTILEPAYTFMDDTNTGMYKDLPADTLGFTTAGTKRFTINATTVQSTVAFRTAGGSAGTPTYSFTGDPNTGFFNAVADEIAVSLGGVQVGAWRQGNLQANTVGVGVFDTTLDGRFANVVFANIHSVTSTNFGNVTVDVASAIGKQSIWVPAAAMTPTVTDGCSTLTTVETTALRPDMQVLDFATDADDHAQFSIAFPKKWNLGTITFQVFWSPGGAVTTGVAWGLAGLAVGDNQTIDAVMGTPTVVTDDAQGAIEELMVTAESGAHTITGTPAADELIWFDVLRDISDGNDDMTQDARLHGLKIFYTTEAETDD